MKGPGIFWMLQTAAGLSMAGPMFVVGFEMARNGRLVAGAGFFALGAVALYFPTYLINRIGGPRTWIRRRLGSSESDDAEDEEPDGASDSDVPWHQVSASLDRLRRQ